jgi:hypothetical protein
MGEIVGRRPKPKLEIQCQLEELNEENRQLRAIVAYLSEVLLTRIVEPSESYRRNRVVPNPNKGSNPR